MRTRLGGATVKAISIHPLGIGCSRVLDRFEPSTIDIELNQVIIGICPDNDRNRLSKVGARGAILAWVENRFVKYGHHDGGLAIVRERLVSQTGFSPDELPFRKAIRFL
jgi:hypothetical protein